MMVHGDAKPVPTRRRSAIPTIRLYQLSREIAGIMEKSMGYEAIIAIVERGEANGVVKKACEAGAKGATIAFGRGSAENVLAGFRSMQIETSKEVIMLIVDKEEAKRILRVVADAAKVDEPGKGIAFTVPIGTMLGFHPMTADDCGDNDSADGKAE